MVFVEGFPENHTCWWISNPAKFTKVQVGSFNTIIYRFLCIPGGWPWNFSEPSTVVHEVWIGRKMIPVYTPQQLRACHLKKWLVGRLVCFILKWPLFRGHVNFWLDILRIDTICGWEKKSLLKQSHFGYPWVKFQGCRVFTAGVQVAQDACNDVFLKTKVSFGIYTIMSHLLWLYEMCPFCTRNGFVGLMNCPLISLILIHVFSHTFLQKFANKNVCLFVCVFQVCCFYLTNHRDCDFVLHIAGAYICVFRRIHINHQKLVPFGNISLR